MIVISAQQYIREIMDRLELLICGGRNDQMRTVFHISLIRLGNSIRGQIKRIAAKNFVENNFKRTETILLRNRAARHARGPAITTARRTPRRLAGEAQSLIGSRREDARGKHGQDNGRMGFKIIRDWRYGTVIASLRQPE